MAKPEPTIRLDLNNPVLQEQLLRLQKVEPNAALGTLYKIRQLSWNLLYRNPGMMWEKITSIIPPAVIHAIYSLRIRRSRRATAHRDGHYMRLLTIAPDHDSTYGKK